MKPKISNKTKTSGKPAFKATLPVFPTEENCGEGSPFSGQLKSDAKSRQYKKEED